MKKGTKIGLSIAATLLGVVALSSCTQSFCSKIDQARMMYAFEPGITRYENNGTDTLEVAGSYKIENVKITVADWYDDINGFAFSEAKKDRLTYFNAIISSSKSAGYVTITKESKDYYAAMDELVIDKILTVASEKEGELNLKLNDEKDYAKFNRIVSQYSYLKFISKANGKLYDTYNEFDYTVRTTTGINPDYCPSTDFVTAYHSKLNSYATNYRTCLTTKTDKYGSYGYATNGIYVEGKTWAEAWQKGLFEGLLVYPIGWLIDQIVVGFRSTGMTSGAAALLGIIFITLIVRSLMMLATLKQNTSNAKMTELQPEIQKIQAKYPNANTSQVEKQRMAEEMNRLYKKNKINPFMTFIVLIVQFPVFICVWGALSGSAPITNGSILGLNLSVSIRDALFSATGWTAAGGYSAVTALFLFLFMAGAQTVSMLLPQWLQKAKAKKVAKLGKNPAQQSQNNQMKIFTYVMLAMIIFMGFSLVSAMGIYWFIGAVFSVAQTLITQLIMSKKSKK